MYELTRPVTKKNLCEKQSVVEVFIFGAIIWGILAIVLGVLNQNWRDMLIMLAVSPIVILVGWIIDRNSLAELYQIIERQERNLGVDFEKDMADVFMCDYIKEIMEATAYGDWYILESEKVPIVIHRQYITGVRQIREDIRHSAHGGSYEHIIYSFDTRDGWGLECTTDYSWEAAADLFSWLGMAPQYAPERYVKFLQTYIPKQVNEGEIHRFYQREMID